MKNNINDKEPLVIKNDYLLKSDLTTRIALLIFFGWLLGINLTPEPDPLDEWYRRMALGTAVLGILVALFSDFRLLIRLIKHKLHIKIYDDKIVYEYITDKGEKKRDVLKKEEIKSIKWAFFPYAVKDTEIWMSEIENKDNKRWAYLFTPIYVLISAYFWFIFFILNKLSLKRYILVRFEDGIISSPYSDEALKALGVDKKDVKFEWMSLINRYIYKGGRYAN
jgi:hypothetical protein